jgi:thiol:disulfide interchange protein DsbD
MGRARHRLLFAAHRLLLAALALVIPCAAAAAGSRARGAMDGDHARVRAELLVHRDAAAPVGYAGVLFELDPGWHLYWRNPGDSGLAPVLRFAFDGGAPQQLDLQWPAPSVFIEDEDLVTFGYEGRVLLAGPVPGEPAHVAVTADVLVCADQCLPASLELARRFRVDAGSGEAARARAIFEEAAAQVPPAADARGVQVALEGVAVDPGGAFRAVLHVRACGAQPSACSLRAPGSARAAFFPHAPAGLAIRAVAISGDAASLRIALEGAASEPIAAGAQLEGVISLAGADGARHSFEVAAPIAVPPAQSPGRAATSLAGALVLGFLGGLLLNLMPCVLPVLAIKVFAVAELARRSRRQVAAHAAAYTAGILVTLMALAACVVALRWSGTAVGWGFHLQEPAFVAAVAAVLVAFAANLLGAFEVEMVGVGLGSLGASAAGARRSFFDGLLAVLLATPCSAPFLGTAIGFAFASAAPVIAAIFAAIGLGLAAPFVAVAAVPAWSRWLPRPGAWMLELRRALGFALLATAVWLLWIVGRAAGPDAMAGLLAVLVAIAFAAFLFGLLQRARGHAPGVLLVGAVAALLVAGLDFVELSAQRGRPEAGAAAPLPYSRPALEGALAAGRPVLVYDTADWCLTCKLNERRVLAHPRSREALAARGFTVLRADWTRRDDAIREELARLGKAGVPVYALYGAGGPGAPRLLPELLRLEPFLNALAETADEIQRAAAPGEWAGR